MSLIGGRRLPSQLLVGLEGSGGGRLGSGGSAGRLPDPLRPSTSSIRASSLLAGVLPTVHQGSRLNPGASDPTSEGGSRTSPSVSGFLQPSIPRPEGFGVVAPHHRPLDPERLRHLVSLPHGDSTVSPSFHPSGRLDGLPGPAGSGSSRFASLSSLRDRRKDIPVQGLFGLTTAPQVFTRIMAPVSATLHKYGVRMLRYLDDWLILASSEIACLESRDRLLTICTELGTQVNLSKSSLSSHSITSVSRHGDSVSAFYSSTYSSTSQQPPALDRGVCVNPISSSVPLASTSGPLVFPHSSRLWRDAPNEAAPALPQGPVGLPGQSVSWSPLCREDLLWWARVAQLLEGVSLSLPAPDVSFFSDASDVGWGALVGEHHASGLWSPHQKSLSINMRELLAVQYGLKALEHLLVGLSVALFCDNTTTVAYLRRSGGTFSSTLNATAREILLWAENHCVRLLPQFIMGSSNVTADALSRPNQVIGSEWTLHQEVVDHLVHKWPAVIDLFATSLTARLPVYFSPASDPQAAGTDALLQSWDNLQAYAFPPIAIIRRVLVKLRSSKNCVLTPIAPFWPQREWFPYLWNYCPTFTSHCQVEKIY